MASIHGGIFLVVGLIVAGASFYKPELLVFRFFGIAFIIYGTFKLLVKFVTDKKDQLKGKPDQDFNNQPLQQFRQNQANMQTIYCKRCGSQNTAFDNFCSYCGNRLR